MNTRLTPKQEAFTLAVLSGATSRQAYRTVYAATRMADAVVDVRASELLHNRKIEVRLAELRAVAAERSIIDRTRMLDELAAVALSDIGEIVTWRDGSFTYRASEDLPERVRRAIQSVKVKRRREVTRRGDDAEVWEVEELEFKLWDKNSAIDKLMRHLGMFPKDNVIIDNRTQSLTIEGAGLTAEQMRELAFKVIEGDE